MTSKREREYLRRRQEKFEERVVAKRESRRRNRLVGGAVAGVAVLAVVGAYVAVSRSGADDPAVASDLPTVAEPLGTATAAEPSAAPADTTCPPAPQATAAPAGFDSVPDPVSGTWTVGLGTSCGDLTLELDAEAAPQGVGSFVSLVQQGWFDETPCHRLTTAGIFVLQCGDPTGQGTGGPGFRFGPIENAPADDVYPAGTVAMARAGGDAESMGSQFFLVYEDSTIPSDAAGGYTVLGQVTAGLDIVQLVAEGGLAADGVAPARSVGIVSATAEESS